MILPIFLSFMYCPIVLAISFIGVICNSVTVYFWGILGKYIIDIYAEMFEAQAKYYAV